MNVPKKNTGRYLSLHWKALIGLSIVLIMVNVSLAFFFYSQSVEQFERNQFSVRDRQAKQLIALLEDRYQQMSRLANLVPLLVQQRPQETLDEYLRRAIHTNGIMLDLEWDIRSMYWSRPGGGIELLWPSNAEALPEGFSESIKSSPDETSRLLVCTRECQQLLAAPLLWHGKSSGALVLGGSLADVLLTFHYVTGGEAAIIASTTTSPSTVESPSTEVRFKAITHPQLTQPLFERALEAQVIEPPSLPGNNSMESNIDRTKALQFSRGDEWYQVFRLRGLAPGIEVLILNNVTIERRAIRAATRNSIVIGVIGLLLSEVLVLLIIRGSLARLRRLSDLLPMLADHHFNELRKRLAGLQRRIPLRDEMDLMVDTVQTISGRMEDTERDRERARKELVWLADHDPLTKLKNRRRFDQELIELVEKAVERGGSGALLFVDLDQFKDVNDISGHQVGDGLLSNIARKLTQSTANRGVLGRLGGDEFAIILPDADGDQAAAMAEDIQDQIRQVIVHSNTWRHQVSASIGIVLFPEHGKDTQQLMAYADLAMYQAKERGRGCWHLFSIEDSGRERANARVLWTERIKAAFRDNRYELHLQPIMEIATKKTERAEALLRMRGPDGKLISPNSFIPIAEETGQIQSIDHWVLAQSITIMRAHPELSLSVNLSANAMQDPSLRADIERLLNKHEVEPSRLTLEITETVAIRSLQSAIQLMHDIRTIGCRFALDDFGSGFASYAYLRQLPVDDVKIDGAFIRGIADSEEDQIFVRAITTMAHNMEKRIIAEFVENGEILHILSEIGVDYAQGYHIGHPLPQLQ